MTFNDDMEWVDLDRECSVRARNLINSMRDANNAYDEWQNYRAGRTNTAIGAALTPVRPEADVAAMDSAFAAMKAMLDYANNQAPVQLDYLFSLRKFA